MHFFKKTVLITSFCITAGLFAGCGSENTIQEDSIGIVQIKDESVPKESGITLTQSKKPRLVENDDVQNFDSAHDFTNFEKKMQRIAELTEPENS